MRYDARGGEAAQAPEAAPEEALLQEMGDRSRLELEGHVRSVL